ncbi:MAG: non-canonical purine NTP pyrophosphatase, RdgB/HAM1 family [Planctomycetes bacterium GWF2_50_10]|nr:MAG: non-canonical purine NTP pyrophosphatase, RdgB/HAM1 family [Planctomycetes bacterium GWF2_50_10]
MRKILIATTNPGKMRELSELLDAKVEWVSLKDFPGLPEVVEDGETFAENAAKKALGYAKATGLWTIADDSGLCIDALGGAPGINSARFCGPKDRAENRHLIDTKNMEKVLQLLKDLPEEKRTARFVCAICLAGPQKILAQTQATWEGVIATAPIGTGGFGYDPIMYIPELENSVGQISAPLKNQLSHRAKAIKLLKPHLSALLKA